jgi:hypothetical protein
MIAIATGAEIEVEIVVVTEAAIVVVTEAEIGVVTGVVIEAALAVLAGIEAGIVEDLAEVGHPRFLWGHPVALILPICFAEWTRTITG